MKTGRNINYFKWIKLSLAVPAAMLFAAAAGLEYATSAGIITLLTIQDTKKETIEISLKRGVAFIMMALLCKGIFSVVGFHIPAYGIFLCIFVLLCYYLKLEGAISMNCVLATHFLNGGDVTLAAMGNEALLLLIGAGLGMAVNWIMPANVKKIRDGQREIESAMKEILGSMADYLKNPQKDQHFTDAFLGLEQLILGLEKEAKVEMQNSFSKADSYFLSYMEMRMDQCRVLQNMQESMVQLEMVPSQGAAISLFLEEIKHSFHEKNNAAGLLEHLEEMGDSFRASDLPKDRREFENRGILMEIIRDLRHFLKIKQQFVLQLTPEEQAKYWEEKGAEDTALWSSNQKR